MTDTDPQFIVVQTDGRTVICKQFFEGERRFYEPVVHVIEATGMRADALAKIMNLGWDAYATKAPATVPQQWIVELQHDAPVGTRWKRSVFCPGTYPTLDEALDAARDTYPSLEPAKVRARNIAVQS